VSNRSHLDFRCLHLKQALVTRFVSGVGSVLFSVGIGISLTRRVSGSGVWSNCGIFESVNEPYMFYPSTIPMHGTAAGVRSIGGHWYGGRLGGSFFKRRPYYASTFQGGRLLRPLRTSRSPKLTIHGGTRRTCERAVFYISNLNYHVALTVIHSSLSTSSYTCHRI